MKKILCIICAALTFGLLFSGCADSTAAVAEDTVSPEQNTEIAALNGRIAELENQLAEMASEGNDETYIWALGINCLLYADGESESDAESEIILTEKLKVKAVPLSTDGIVFDHWSINGEPIEGPADGFAAEVSKSTVIEAVFHEELKVTSVNAYMQFLDEKDKPDGDKFYEYIFEYNTDKVSAGFITLYVCAEVPKGYELNHWLINDVPYYYNKTVTSFKVYDLHAITKYEAVFKKEAKATAKPTAAPTAKPTAAPTAQPTKTPAPVMVSVSCTNSTFSGGGYSNATSGTVVKGTSITVTGTTDIGNPQYWEINGASNTSYGKTFTYTVNSNTTFKYTGYN